MSPTLNQQNIQQKTTKLTLFLCYPPPDSDMALKSLRKFIELNGKIVCYVGEYRGHTGTISFERLLQSTYNCIELIPLPNWGDTAYNLTIWRKKNNANNNGNINYSILHPCHQCIVCKEYYPIIHRCRISYNLSFCSNVCALSMKGKEYYMNELIYRCLLNPIKKQISLPNNEIINEFPNNVNNQENLQIINLKKRNHLESLNNDNNFEETNEINSLENIDKNKKNKKRKKLTKIEKLRIKLTNLKNQSNKTLQEQSVVEVQEDSKNNSNSDSDEDIPTQLMKFKGKEIISQSNNVRMNGFNNIDEVDIDMRIVFSSQWFMRINYQK